MPAKKNQLIESAKKTALDNMRKFLHDHGETVAEMAEMISNDPTDRGNCNGSPEAFYKMLKECRILLLTANQVEEKMVIRYMEEPNGEPLSAMSVGGCMYRIGKLAGVFVAHVHTLDIGSFGEKGSEQAVEDALKLFRPRLVISLGGAYGNDAEFQKLGDVLISKKLYSITYVKNDKGDISYSNGTLYETDADLVSTWGEWFPWHRTVFPNTSSPNFTDYDEEKMFYWSFDTVVSAGIVLSDPLCKKKLLKDVQRAGAKSVIGGEMEGSGVYIACQKKGIPCAVVKGICDWGIEKNAWNLAAGVNETAENDRLKRSEVLSETAYNRLVSAAPESLNEIIKNGVQALATHNAIRALEFLLKHSGYLLRYDKEELKCYRELAEENKRLQESKLKEDLEELQRRMELDNQRSLEEQEKRQKQTELELQQLQEEREARQRQEKLEAQRRQEEWEDHQKQEKLEERRRQGERKIRQRQAELATQREQAERKAHLRQETWEEQQRQLRAAGQRLKCRVSDILRMRAVAFVLVFILPVAFVLIYGAPWEREPQKIGRDIFYSSQFLVMLLILFGYGIVLIIVYLFAWREFHFRPENAEADYAYLKLWSLNIRNCFCIFQNIHSEPIRKIALVWRKGNKDCRNLTCEELMPSEGLRVSFRNVIPVEREAFLDEGAYLSAAEYDNMEESEARICMSPTQPDMLQIEYDLDGERICHVFRQHRKIFSGRPFYSERVFQHSKGLELIRRTCRLSPQVDQIHREGRSLLSQAQPMQTCGVSHEQK